MHLPLLLTHLSSPYFLAPSKKVPCMETPSSYKAFEVKSLMRYVLKTAEKHLKGASIFNEAFVSH